MTEIQRNLNENQYSNGHFKDNKANRDSFFDYLTLYDAYCSTFINIESSLFRLLSFTQVSVAQN